MDGEAISCVTERGHVIDQGKVYCAWVLSTAMTRSFTGRDERERGKENDECFNMHEGAAP
jgi:hypothetical protein